MAKSDLIEMEGIVQEVLPNNMYRVVLEKNNHELLCYLGGRLKQNKIKIILGDSVRIELSPYDLTRGRITYRN